MDNIKNPQKRMLAREASSGCNPESLYGAVYSERTQHFIIYYTTEGSHRVKTLAYIDSLALYLEQAYKLHTDSLGMKRMQGATQTYHYQQRVPAGLYPVEVIDTGLLRGEEGEYSGTFGLTFAPNYRSPTSTQIAIENDFLYGADCSGKESTMPFRQGNINYSVNWDLALKVTTFHELYHSFQITQYNKFDSFWLEASATGVEEIGAPEVNDYVNYLSTASGNSGKSMEDTEYGYEYVSLYLFLFSELGPKFDSHIWDYFSKYPSDKFAVQLARLADSLGINSEDLFHKYAQGIFFSGNRASIAQAQDYLFWPEDQRSWPMWNSRNSALRILPATAIDFVKNTNNQQPNTDSAMISLLQYGDSTVWVLSRLLEQEYIPPPPPKEFVAYPNPWNPNRVSELKFKDLPENSSGIEIRSANGALLERIKEKDEDIIIWQPKRLPAPGILYYRYLPYGKNKVLIVEY